MVVLTSFPPPSTGIHHTEQNTVAFVKDQDFGKGTLYIAESRVSWFNTCGQGFSLEYPSINLHAVSKDLNSFPEQCLYVMIEAHLDEPADPKKDTSESSDDDDDSNADPELPITEIRFVPDNKACLEDLFKAMSECQALNPDPGDLSDDDFIDGNYDDAEEENGFYFADDGSGVTLLGDGYQNGDHIASSPAIVVARNTVVGGGDGPDDDLGFQNGVEDEPMDVGQFEDADQ